MKILKWTSTKEYYNEEDGIELTKNEVDKNFIIKKTQKDVTIQNVQEINGQKFGEGKITYRHICTKHGKQQRLFND